MRINNSLFWREENEYNCSNTVPFIVSDNAESRDREEGNFFRPRHKVIVNDALG